MKRTFIALLIAAVAVWSWAVLQILGPLFQPGARNREKSAIGADMPLRLAMARTAVPAFRDPFQSYLYAEKPVAPKSASGPRRVVAVPEEAPRIKVNGIMLGDSPMAILEQDGKTEFARPGQEIFGFQVRTVEAGKVVLRKQGKTYTLTYP